MIKINLATKKQSIAAAADSKAASSRLSGFKFDGRLDGLKDLPIRKIVLMLLVGYGASYFSSDYQAGELTKAQAGLDKVLTDQKKLKVELAKTSGYEEVQKSLEADELSLNAKISTIKKLMADRQTPPQLLMSIAKAIPDDVWLKSLKIDDTDVTFTGSSLGFNQISDFMKNLNESAYFTDVRLQTTQQETPGAGTEIANFELAAKRR